MSNSRGILKKEKRESSRKKSKESAQKKSFLRSFSK